ncbi:MAG: nucleoside deaminase [Alphaproteobacteria bacterium]|nr:nucleoside deaminase [Alphaproteobacteria bacterium]
MQRALHQAILAANLGEVPVGAVLMAADDDTLLAEGHNRTRLDNDPSAHAEIVVLRQAAENLAIPRLPGTRLYVTLEPCPMCAGAIIQARIAQLVFGAYDPKYGAITHGVRLFDQTNINHRPEALGGIAESDCRGLLKTFFDQRR